MKPDPWRVRRAAYLLETGRLDQLEDEGLQHEAAAWRLTERVSARDAARVPLRERRAATSSLRQVEGPGAQHCSST
jgi:hypothetical protein